MRRKEFIVQETFLSRPFRAVVGWVRTQGVALGWLVPGRWPEGRLLRFRVIGVRVRSRESTLFSGSRLPMTQSGSRLPQSKGFARAVVDQGGVA
jgi:hypothetical protein